MPFLTKQYWFRDLMVIEKGEQPPKKESNVIPISHNSKDEELEVIEEYEEAISLDRP